MIDAAKEKGGRVIMTPDGAVTLEFGQPANEHAEDHDEVEARRISELMKSTMGTAKQ